MTTDWKPWDTNPPEAGQKVAILCNDGCSISAALAVDNGQQITALEAEDGWDLGTAKDYLRGSLWCALPDNYPLHFMENSHDD